MQFPIQAQSVNRTRITAAVQAAVSQSNCNPWMCEFAFDLCADACIGAQTSQACRNCLGPTYNDCVGCF